MPVLFTIKNVLQSLDVELHLFAHCPPILSTESRSHSQCTSTVSNDYLECGFNMTIRTVEHRDQPLWVLVVDLKASGEFRTFDLRKTVCRFGIFLKKTHFKNHIRAYRCPDIQLTQLFQSTLLDHHRSTPREESKWKSKIMN